MRSPVQCSECGGSGEKAYGSTATWRGGIGGQMITNAVCNKCWGSGDEANPGPDPRMQSRLKSLTKA